MILSLVSKVPENSFGNNKVYLETKSLQYSATHLYIAANTFEKLEIELCDDIPDNVLTLVSKQAGDIDVKLPSVVTDKTVRLLCELYPDKAGRIRRYKLLHRDLKEALV